MLEILEEASDIFYIVDENKNRLHQIGFSNKSMAVKVLSCMKNAYELGYKRGVSNHKHVDYLIPS